MALGQSMLDRLTRRGAMIGVVCALISWIVSLHRVSKGLEDWFQDACFAYRGTRATAARIVIVALDADSLRALPKPFAFASDELAHVIRYLLNQNVAGIGLDVIVPEELDGFKGLESGPRDLGDLALDSGRVVLAAIALDDDRIARPLADWRVPFQGSQNGLVTLGMVNFTEDMDHFVRRQQLAFRVKDRPYFALAPALLALGDPKSVTTSDGRLHIDHKPVPLDDAGSLRINFVGPAGSIPHVAFHAVLRARSDGPPLLDHRGKVCNLKGALVIIGVTSPSLGDLHAVPYSNGTLRGLLNRSMALMSGPEVHANVTATLADRAFITTPPWLHPLPLALVLGALLGIAFSKLTLAQGAMLAIIHHFAWKALGVAAFVAASWRIEMIPMLLTGAITYGLTFAFRWRWLRQTFGVVKGETVARALENDVGHMRLKGESREVTILFSDIRNFTAFSEVHSPREVVTLLNTYFAAVVPEIEARGGVLDKYIGDGIMAIFGAPEPFDDHAVRAVGAAQALVGRVHAAARRWAELGF
ncbi:MAG TPA: adenylate/guanylate cyclase domain-containing protein, partial [Isosphaeraceae bacterium]|nr:adenylate/guanylate cyclase domain-containing protein [Isosphaeraceae bacterium]